MGSVQFDGPAIADDVVAIGATACGVDVIGMLFIGIVLMGLETKFDNDLIGDCSNNASALVDCWSTLSPLVSVCSSLRSIFVNDVTMLRRLSNSSVDKSRSRCCSDATADDVDADVAVAVAVDDDADEAEPEVESRRPLPTGLLARVGHRLLLA